MTHPSEMISAYLDGELTRAESSRLFTHMGSCGRCVAEMEAIRNNNFNTVGSAMGAGRSLHAQNHDDGCL